MAIKYGITAAAMRVSELAYQLETNAADDDAEVEVYTDKEILEEALYVRSKYDGGWIHSDMLNGTNGKEEQKIAIKEVRELDKFINFWKEKVQ